MINHLQRARSRDAGRHGALAAGLLSLVLLLGISACDDTFEPIARGERSFSIFGYLDPAADTQWIRVMPLRSTVFTSEEPFAVSVTLEEVGTGRSLEIRDSLFTYPYPFDEALEVDGVHVHNYWTTDAIVPGRTYRFTAVGPDGESATTMLPIPKDFTISVAVNTGTGPRLGGWPMDLVRVEGVDHVAFVRVQTLVRPRCVQSRGVQELRYDVPEESVDPHVIPVTKIYGFALDAECNPQVAERRDLRVVASGTPWPVGDGFDEEALGAADLPTNLSHAVGFLGGVLTRTVPYEDCEFVGQAPLPDFCVLTYDESKATLTGTIRDVCGNAPLADATVRLEQLTANADGHRRVRTSPTGLTGEFRIAGLDAGAYALRVSHPHERSIPPATGGFPKYVAHADTLTFMPGEDVELGLTLQRVDPC